jgi:UDPglucose 6-dehydrogenase
VRVGFVGLGNLGLPCALAIEHYGGFEVMGFDCSEKALQPLKDGRFPRIEPGVQELLETTRILIKPIAEMATTCDVIFVAVQTPHDPKFEGITALTDERVDFDYTYLKRAVKEVADSAQDRTGIPLIVNVVSTVLPGTMAREIEPLLNDKCWLCYNPFFIAMGTTIQDFMNPEFVLLGTRNSNAAARMLGLYGMLYENRRVCDTSVESAELIKVSYNTFIGLKLAFVNCLMEVCDKTGGNVDDVTSALCMATDRLISPRYMKAGMGDGGGCHPRDNVAMSWLARELGLSYDLFEAAMLSREGQTKWLAGTVIRQAQELGLPVVILGTAYKADSDLSTGSPALLLIDLLRRLGAEPIIYDPIVKPESDHPTNPGVFVVATDHTIFRTMDIPTGSLLLDPWGNQPKRQGVQLLQPGR